MELFLRLAVCVFEKFLVFNYLNSVLPRRKNISSVMAGFILVVLGCVTLGVNLLENSTLNLIGSSILAVLIIVTIFDVTWKDVVVRFFILTICSMSSELLVCILYDVDLNSTVSVPWIDMLAAMLRGVMYYAISRNRGTDGGERKYFFLLKIMYPVITAILIFLISRLIMANGGKSYGIEWGIMLLMGANIISFRFIEKAVDMIREKESYQRASEANALKVERYEELEREQKAWMQREHDLSKHLTAIGGLAKEKKDQEILDILDGIRVQIGEIQDAYYVKNGVVNALLKVKLSEARREGISVDFYAEPNISLDDYDIGDMIAIIGNQFENAIEASGRCEGEKKIWARYYCLDNRQIVLEMENSFMDVPMKAGVMNSTSKADNERHGMGMRIIRETVDRNEGLFYTDKVNGFFRSVIVLPQKEKVIC